MLGRAAGIAASGGYAVGYGYDAVGRFAVVSNTVDVFTYSYVTNSSLLAGVASAVPGGFAVSYAFEPNRNVKTQVLNKWGGTTISQFDYTSDAVGRRTKRVDTLSTTNTFGYNGRSELASALMGTNTFGYVYDPIGNRLTATNNTEVWHYGANQLNQYTNITDGVTLTPLYDADGNLTNDSVRAYTWDAENRLLAVEPLSPTNGAQRVFCAYDYMSRRIGKLVETWDGSSWGSAVTNTFVYDAWNLLVEVGASGSLVRTNSYTWGLDLSQSLQGAGGIGGLLTARLAGTNVFYYHDANGNVTELANASGNVVGHYKYDPFGNTLVKSGTLADANPYRFSAKYADPETGLIYYGYRYYQPSTGRWLNRDPLGDEVFFQQYARGKSRKEVNALRKESLGNPYGFVNNDPVDWVDYFGLYGGGANAAETAWCKANPICCLAAKNSGKDVKAEMGKRYPNWQDNTVENAVQHCAWMCYVVSMTCCSKGDANSLGQAHENYPGNPVHDKAMDLHNNNVGLNIGGKNLTDCFNKCEQAAKDHKLYWWQAVNPGPPRQGLPGDFPGFTVGNQGNVTGGTVGTGSPNPPTAPAP